MTKKVAVLPAGMCLSYVAALWSQSSILVAQKDG